jgi:hypothetical protein
MRRSYEVITIIDGYDMNAVVFVKNIKTHRS